MATLKDIAQRCGTSIATVSYVLSGRGEERRISTAMQEKVIRTADELGYSYSIKNKKHGAARVGVFWPQKHLEMLMPAFVDGMNAAMFLSPRPVEVSIRPFERGFLDRQQYLWIRGHYDAAVVVSPTRTDLGALSNRQTAIPTVLFNRSLPGYFSAGVDHNEIARLGAEEAMRLGGGDIALVAPGADLYGADVRVRRVLELCAARGYDISGNILYSENDVESGYVTGQQMLLERKVKKVILCVYDVVAMGLDRALSDAGIRVGEDVEIIAMSSIYERTVARIFPEISMIDMRLTEVATLAVNLAIEAAANPEADPQEITLHPQMILRKTR